MSDEGISPPPSPPKKKSPDDPELRPWRGKLISYADQPRISLPGGPPSTKENLSSASSSQVVRPLTMKVMTNNPPSRSQRRKMSRLFTSSDDLPEEKIPRTRGRPTHAEEDAEPPHVIKRLGQLASPEEATGYTQSLGRGLTGTECSGTGTDSTSYAMLASPTVRRDEPRLGPAASPTRSYANMAAVPQSADEFRAILRHLAEQSQSDPTFV